MRGLGTALLLLILCGAARGEGLHYRGENSLWQDTVWDGEVLVDGILTIPPGVTLHVRPGTTVRFTRRETNGDGIGEHELFIQGRLLASGTAEAPVRFTSAEVDPRPGDWGAINIMASEEENLLEQVEIEYAYRGFHAHFARASLADCRFRRNVRGLQFQESTVAIARCRVSDNLNGLQFRDSKVTLADSVVEGNYWGVRCVYSELALSRCRVEGNLVNGVNLRDSSLSATANRISGNRKGLYLQRSRCDVTGNELLDNSEHGILLEESDCRVTANRIAGNGRAGVKWIDARGSLAGNRLDGNGTWALYNEGAGEADARGNWWGSADPGAIAAAIRDGEDLPGMGRVDASDPLEEPPILPKLELREDMEQR